MKKLRLKESCTLYTVTRDRYGDHVTSSPQTISCLYRDMSLLQRDGLNREQQNIQGIFWFDPTSSVVKGSVIKYNDQFYLIEQVINAKTLLTTDSIEFIKCLVSVYRAVS